MIRLLFLVVILFVPGAGSEALLLGQGAEPADPQPQQQDEFVPIDELPAQDQLPAAPLLVAAYSFVALALFAYVVSVARRMATVQRELERLESDLKRSGRT
jgi:CcmD family protein